MKRPRNKTAKKKILKLFIDILDKEVGYQFGSKKNLSRFHLHETPDHKYSNIFLRVIDYLEELRGNHKNSIKSLIKDYLMSVYDYYWKFNRIPTITQLSPSTSNQIRFEEYTYEISRNNDESYWLDESHEPDEIIEVPLIEFDELPSFVEYER